MTNPDLTHVTVGQTLTWDDDDHWTVQAHDERHVVVTRTPTANDRAELAAEGHTLNGDLLFVALDRATGEPVIAGQRHPRHPAAEVEAAVILAELAEANIERPTASWLWFETPATFAAKDA